MFKIRHSKPKQTTRYWLNVNLSAMFTRSTITMYAGLSKAKCQIISLCPCIRSSILPMYWYVERCFWQQTKYGSTIQSIFYIEIKWEKKKKNNIQMKYYRKCICSLVCSVSLYNILLLFEFYVLLPFSRALRILIYTCFSLFRFFFYSL